MLRKYTAIFAMIVVFSSCCIPVLAVAEKSDSLSISAGEMEYNTALQNTIDNFFALRSFENVSPQSANNLTAYDPVRMAAFQQYSEDTQLTIVSATSTPIIESATYNEDGDVVLEVYEWVSVSYIPAGSSTVDYMGYETQHTMTLRNMNGSYVCIDDINDELDLLLYGDCLPTEEISYTPSFTETESSANYITFSDYDVDALIDYADSWVEHTIHSETASGPHKYNPDYGFFTDNDCANFVSQCMYAGGIPFNEGSGRNNSSYSQWWFDSSKVVSGQSNLYTTCPPPWRSVSALTSYFEDEGYEIQSVKSGGSNLYPGNPVYASGHIVICVGYNSAGTPICNGHTRDVWHYVYNYATASSGRSTILIVDEDLT